MERVSRILASTPVQTGLESIAIALASHRRAFLAGAECNPSRQVRQDESNRVEPCRKTLRRRGCSRGCPVNEVLVISIVRVVRETSGFRQARLEKSHQVWHVRMLFGTIGTSIQQHG
jgi:hypothetical protein